MSADTREGREPLTPAEWDEIDAHLAAAQDVAWWHARNMADAVRNHFRRGKTTTKAGEEVAGLVFREALALGFDRLRACARLVARAKGVACVDDGGDT